MLPTVLAVAAIDDGAVPEGERGMQAPVRLRLGQQGATELRRYPALLRNPCAFGGRCERRRCRQPGTLRRRCCPQDAGGHAGRRRGAAELRPGSAAYRPGRRGCIGRDQRPRCHGGLAGRHGDTDNILRPCLAARPAVRQCVAGFGCGSHERCRAAGEPAGSYRPAGLDRRRPGARVRHPERQAALRRGCPGPVPGEPDGGELSRQASGGGALGSAAGPCPVCP